LLALDRDPEAVAAGLRIAREWNDLRFEIVHSRFSDLEELLVARGIEGVDGILFDLGISSPQVDDASRGFSFVGDGPLDMRMDPTQGMSAREWLMSASEQDIAEVLKRYGDERFAVPIAKTIAARRGEAGGEAFQTTRQLADVVAGVVRRRQRKPEVGKNPATRTFQALRIHTNNESGELSRALEVALRRLVPGGRMAVISFHSIEDRMVKQFISLHSGKSAARHPITGAPLAAATLRDCGRVLPGEAEVTANPRARSAVLRIAERIDTASGT
jgi:16S rRNA (cytosine1402-N4)-methyltransferase